MASRIRQTLLQRFEKQGKKKEIQELYEQESYLDAYSKHTDLRVDKNPHEAIGGHWDEMGQLQIRFLIDNGLKPQHRMLDIGCGTLRGGRHFIRYLEPDHYTGIDISKKALAYCEELLIEEKLTDKQPTLVLNQEMRLRFSMFTGQTFDYLFAQSVFTHLPTEYIDECFEHVKKIMTPDSLFFFTFFCDDEHNRRGLKDFSQPWSFYEELAERHGYLIENRTEDYPHPSQQNMAILTCV